MKCEPEYVSLAQRTRAAWTRMSAKLGLPEDVVREVYFVGNWFAGVGARQLHQLVDSGRITAKEYMSGFTIEGIRESLAQKAAKRDPNQRDIDDEQIDQGDRVNFNAKGVIEVGDYIEAEDTKTFLSGGEYITKGKRYRVKSLTDEGYGSFALTTTTNFRAPDNIHYTSCHAVRRIFRARKLIWDWRAAWIRDWNEHHPDNPYPMDDEDSALFAKLGWPQP